MRILISSLQVSQGASKGHLHPAIEIGLELKRRGHTVGILPLPNPFSKADKEQIDRCEFEIIEPPSLPQGLPFSPQKLGELAKHADTAAQAYHSFLVAPLEHQFDSVAQKVKAFSPDVVVYDLLVYAAPLAARLLGIPDIGYCAGLKLIAPSALTANYQSIHQELLPDIHQFLKKRALTAEFHHLELLSNSGQLVFTPQAFIGETGVLPRKTSCVGSLPISSPRCEPDATHYPDKDFAVLCFGSVLDPANYSKITNILLNIAKQFNQHLIISTQKPHLIPDSENSTTASYLSLPQLLKNASLFIHHGGANTFSESLTLGVPQLLIPLTTDQPIQASFLKQSQAGIAISPDDVTEETVYAAFEQLLDKNHPIHKRIKAMKALFQQSNGAAKAAELIEHSALLTVAL